MLFVSTLLDILKRALGGKAIQTQPAPAPIPLRHPSHDRKNNIAMGNSFDLGRDSRPNGESRHPAFLMARWSFETNPNSQPIDDRMTALPPFF